MQKLFTSNSRKQLYFLPLRLTVISLLFAGFCIMGKIIILEIGQKFDRLTVLSKELPKNGHGMYKCLCICGKETITRGSALLTGNTKSCGCLDLETTIIGFSKYRETIVNGATENGKSTPEYDSYNHMKERCYNPKVDRYPCYGGRGITVCERWLKGFSYFLEDMGRRPSKNHSLDRYPDVHGNYCPENCRWGTEEQQYANKQNTIRLIVNGEEVHQALLARTLGVNPHSIEYHIKKGKTGDEIVAYFKNKNKC